MTSRGHGVSGCLGLRAHVAGSAAGRMDSETPDPSRPCQQVCSSGQAAGVQSYVSSESSVPGRRDAMVMRTALAHFCPTWCCSANVIASGPTQIAMQVSDLHGICLVRPVGIEPTTPAFGVPSRTASRARCAVPALEWTEALGVRSAPPLVVRNGCENFCKNLHHTFHELRLHAGLGHLFNSRRLHHPRQPPPMAHHGRGVSPIDSAITQMGRVRRSIPTDRHRIPHRNSLRSGARERHPGPRALRLQKLPHHDPSATTTVSASNALTIEAITMSR